MRARPDSWNTLRSLALGVVSLVVTGLVAGSAAAAGDGGPSIAVYGGYSGWWDHVDLKAYQLEANFPYLYARPVGSKGLNGAVATGQIEGVVRYATTSAWYGMRPTVAVAYREIVGSDTKKSSPTIFRIFPIAFHSDVERKLLRSVALEIGAEVPLDTVLEGVRLRAFLGPDFSEYRHLLRSYGLSGENGTAIDRAWFPGLRSGLELTAPVGVDVLGGVSIALRTVYTRYFGDPSRLEVNVPPLDESLRYAHLRRSRAMPEDSLSVQIGIELALY